MRQIIASVIQVLGLALITTAAAIWSTPAGFLVGGVSAVLFGIAVEIR